MCMCICVCVCVCVYAQHLSLCCLYRIFSKIVSSWLTNFPDAEDNVRKLVRATIAVYSTITTQLLPTPAKSHYTFNLRDLSKVFQGMLMAQPSKFRVCAVRRNTL